MQMVNGPYGPTNTVAPKENAALKELLGNTIRTLDAHFSAEPTIDDLPEENSEKEKIPEGVRPFTYYVDNGTLYFAEADSAAEYKAKDDKERFFLWGQPYLSVRRDRLPFAYRRECYWN